MNRRVQRLSFIGFLVTAGLVFLPAAAQAASATAEASATVLAPIAIKNTSDLSFGLLASPAVAESIVIEVVGGVRSANLAANLLAQGPSSSRAAFEVTGTPNLSYSIGAVDSALSLTNATGVAMAVVLTGVRSSELEVTGAVATATQGKLSSSGVDTLYIGGRLALPVNAVAGFYTNSNGISLTVDYN